MRQDDVGTLYLEHGQELRRFLTRRLACADTASELTQEAFGRLLHRRRAGPLDNPRAYLYRIAANLVTDHLRGRVRSPAALEADQLERLADHGPGQERVLLAKEDVRRLERAIAELSPRRREVLRLHKFDGLSYGEIAERLGIAKNTVMVHMMKALAHCRRRLADDD